MDRELELEVLSGASPVESELYLAMRQGLITPKEAAKQLRQLRLAGDVDGIVKDLGPLGQIIADRGDADLEFDDYIDEPGYVYEGEFVDEANDRGYLRALRRVDRVQDYVGQRAYWLWAHAVIALERMSDKKRYQLQTWLCNGVALGACGSLLVQYASELQGTWQSVGVTGVGALAAVGAAARGTKLHKEVVRHGKLRAIRKEKEELEARIAAGLEDPRYYELLPDDEKARSLFIALRMYGIHVLLKSISEGFAIKRYLVVITNEPARDPMYAVGVKSISDRASDLKIALRSERRPIVESIGPDGGIAIDVILTPDERKVASFWKYIVEDDETPRDKPLLPVGVDNFTGKLVYIDLSEHNTSQILIAGTTGSGKSHLTMNMLWTIALRFSPSTRPVPGSRLQASCFILDPKKTFPPSVVDYMPHVVNRVSTIEDIRQVLSECVTAMHRRNTDIEGFGSVYDFNQIVEPEFVRPIYFIFVDELTEISKDEECKTHLETLARMGRSGGFHIISNTQRPSADSISTQMRSNLTCRIMLQVKSEYDSWIIAGAEGDARGRWLGPNGDLILFGLNPEGERLVGLYFQEYDKAMKKMDIQGLKELVPIVGGWTETPISRRRAGLGLSEAGVVQVDAQVEALRDDDEHQEEMKRLEAQARKELWLTYGIPTEEHEAVKRKLQKLLKGRDSYVVFQEYREWRENGLFRTNFLKKYNMKGTIIENKALHIIIRRHLNEWVKDLLDKSDRDIAIYIWGVPAAHQQASIDAVNLIQRYVGESRAQLMSQLAEVTGKAQLEREAPVQYERPQELHAGEALADAEQLEELAEAGSPQLEVEVEKLNRCAATQLEESPKDEISQLLEQVDKSIALGQMSLNDLLVGLEPSAFTPKRKKRPYVNGDDKVEKEKERQLEQESEAKREERG